LILHFLWISEPVFNDFPEDGLPRDLSDRFFFLLSLGRTDLPYLICGPSGHLPLSVDPLRVDRVLNLCMIPRPQIVGDRHTFPSRLFPKIRNPGFSHPLIRALRIVFPASFRKCIFIIPLPQGVPFPLWAACSSY